jgi:hypothetical protein
MPKSKYSERRSTERFVMSAERPVYFRTIHDGVEVLMLVENLSMGGALLMCPGIYESLRPGQRLSDGALVLSEANCPRVDVIVRWQFWPRIGVQFDGLTRDAAGQISELIETLQSNFPSVE